MFASAGLGAAAGAGLIALFLVVLWYRGAQLGRQKCVRGAEMVTAADLPVVPGSRTGYPRSRDRSRAITVSVTTDGMINFSGDGGNAEHFLASSMPNPRIHRAISDLQFTLIRR